MLSYRCEIIAAESNVYHSFKIKYFEIENIDLTYPLAKAKVKIERVIAVKEVGDP